MIMASRYSGRKFWVYFEGDQENHLKAGWLDAFLPEIDMSRGNGFRVSNRFLFMDRSDTH